MTISEIVARIDAIMAQLESLRQEILGPGSDQSRVPPPSPFSGGGPGEE